MKRIKSLLVAFVAVIAILVITKTAEAATLSDLRAKFPDGKYWNHYVSSPSECGDQVGYRNDESYANSVTSTPCASHSNPSAEFYVGKYDCNYFDGAWQCMGFARKLGYDAFGTRVSTWRKHSSIASVKPGDVVHLWGPGTDATYGHTVFVAGVSGSTITVAEANFTNAPCLIRWGRTYNLNSYTFEVYSAPYALSEGQQNVSVSWDHYADKHWIGSTNAVLAGWANLNVDVSAVTRAGIYLYDYAGNYITSKSEAVSFSGFNYLSMWYDVNSELGYTLKAGTPYKYKFFMEIGGKTYYSPVYDFTTGGTHTHAYNSGTTTKSPTCTATGVKTYTCTTCGGTKTETIAKKDHNYKSATCTSPKTCTVCGATSGSALGHSYNSGTVTKSPSCTATGTMTYTCNRCSGTKTETIAAKGHSYKSATCTAAKTCTTCGATSGSPLGHSYNSDTVTKSPSCTATGTMTYTCNRCGGTKTETIAAKGHSYKSATCTAAKTCTTCGATSGSPLGHSYNSGVTTKAPTYTSTGIKTYTCTTCGATKTETIAMLVAPSTPVTSPSSTPSTTPKPVPTTTPSTAPKPVPTTTPSTAPKPVPTTTPATVPTTQTSTLPGINETLPAPTPAPTTSPTSQPTTVPTTEPTSAASGSVIVVIVAIIALGAIVIITGAAIVFILIKKK